MKATHILLCVFAFFLIYGCISKDEKMQNDIIGKYNYSKSEKIDEYSTLKITGTLNLKASGRVIEDAIFIFYLREKSIGNVSLKYNIIITGSYYIKNSYLVYNYDLNNLIFEPVIVDEFDDTEQQLHKIYDPILNDQFLPVFKKELLNNSETKINNIGENTLVIENSNGICDYFEKVE